MKGKRRAPSPRGRSEELYVAKKQDGQERGGVSWPCFPAKHIGGTQAVGDRSSSRRPRSVQFRGQEYVLFFVIRNEDDYGLGRHWRALGGWLQKWKPMNAKALRSVDI